MSSPMILFMGLICISVVLEGGFTASKGMSIKTDL